MLEDMGDIDVQYNKIVKVSIYFSIWLLSFMILYTYLNKYQSTIEYNKLITKMNTKKLTEQIKLYNEKCKTYYKLTFPGDVMNKEHEIHMVGLMESKKDLYNELLKTIELYEKCNYVRTVSGNSPFPYTEVSMSVILLGTILGVIVVSNLSNNPFNIVGKTEKLKQIGKNISNLNVFNKVQTGGGVNNSSEVLNLLQIKKLQIKTELSLMKSNMTINYILVAFSILSFTFYMVYNMFRNAINYGNNLYSGGMFMKSRCYKS